MADTNCGLFLPVCDADIDIVRGDTAGHISPTAPNSDQSIFAPEASMFVDVSGDYNLEVDCGVGLINPDIEPTKRPLISDEIQNAIRNNNMSLMLKNNFGSKGYNCDLGPNNVQIPGACGLYQDHKVRASLVFNKNDLALDGGTSVADNNYNGKSRPPVFDYFDAARFYESDGETVYEPINIFWPSIYSDDTHVYAVAAVPRGVSDSAKIVLFRLDPYTRRFIQRGIVSDTFGESLYDVVYNEVIDATTSIPMCPVVCRVANFKNKLVCMYFAVNASDHQNAYLYVAHSFDDGLTWNKITKIGFSGFFEHMRTYIPYGDFRLRMVSNGADILAVWSSDTATSSINRQMRWLLSRDGGITWEYSTTNMIDMFIANQSLDDDIDNETPGVDCNMKFGLVVNSDGLFVLAKAGDGLTGDENLKHGAQYAIFYYADCSGALVWQQGGKINLNSDYNTNIDTIDQDRVITEISLFTDYVHGWDYAIITISIDEMPETGFVDDTISCLVRYKLMLKEEWTTSPDWYDTGIASERNAEHIILMEPPNRNMVFFATANSLTAHLYYFTGCCHRGHLFIMGLAYTAVFPFVVCFKSWTNVPINYGLRQSYLPICSSATSPTDQGWTHAATSVNITETLAAGENTHMFELANGDYTLGGPTSYWDTGASTNIVAYFVGEEEYVVRFVLIRGDIKNDGRVIRVLTLETPIYNPTVPAWRQSLLNIFIDANGVIFGDQIGVDLVSWACDSDVWYEYMVIRSGYELSIWTRRFVDDTCSAIVESWILIYSSNGGSDIGLVGTGSYIHFGAMFITPAVWGMNTYWGFKSIVTSKSITDIYPYKYNYKLYDRTTGVSYNPSLDKGVLSSEAEWAFDRADIANNLRCSVRGEFVSPNPIWVGNDWLAFTYSAFAKDALLFANMLSRDFSSSPFSLTKNSGTFNGDLMLGDGTIPTMPIQLYPMGFNFDGSDYLEVINGTEFDQLTDNFTISAWIRPAAATTIGYIISKQNGGGAGTGYSMYFQGTTDTIWMVGGTFAVQSGAVFTEYDQWIFLTIVIQNGIAYFYKNGISAGSASFGAIPVNVLPIYIGARFPLASYFTGSILKPAIFNYVLNQSDIKKLYMEGLYGPMIPSDFFIRCFGSKTKFNTESGYDTWRLVAKDYGGASDNVLDNNPGSKYYSSRNGRYGIAPGGGGYNDGDVEVGLQRRDGGCLIANSIYIGNCNATDVAIYAQDADPLLPAGWAAALFLGNYQLHHRDEDNGEPLNLYYSALGSLVNGVFEPSTELRHGRYVGKRLLICDNSNPDHYGGGADASLNYIQKVVYNNNERVQIDDKSLTFGGSPLWVRSLSDRLLINFGTTYVYRYWRFVFTNNAKNGEYISVGTIRLGNLMLFSDNIDANFSYAHVAEEINSGGTDIGIPHYLAYGDPKFEFNFGFTMSDCSSMTNDINLLKEAFKLSMMLGEPIYFTRGFYNGQDGTSLVYECAPTGDLQQDIQTIPYISSLLKLKEL